MARAVPFAPGVKCSASLCRERVTIPIACLRANWPIGTSFMQAPWGMIDNTSILAVRDGSLNPLPFGTPLSNNTVQNEFYFYGQDVWRI